MRFNASELQYLERNWKQKSIGDLAQHLKRSRASVRNRLWRSRWVLFREWTEKEIEKLVELYSSDGRIELAAFAKSINRNKANVCRKARQLGLKTTYHRIKTFEERSPMVQARILRQRRTPEAVHEARSFKARERIKRYGHPRGFRELRICPTCGRFFDVEHSNPKRYCNRECSYKRPRSVNMYSRGKGGKRKDLGNVYFRSRYEANYARYLNFLMVKGNDIARWEYEPDTFEFSKIKRGIRFYTPDFKVTFKSGHIEYHEVKGWDYPRGVTARKRMAKYYPHIKLVLVGEEFFKAVRIQGFHRLIDNWE